MIKKGEIIKINIVDYAFGGKGIGRINDEKTIVFIKDGIPGQIVNARITKKKQNYAEASITEVIKKSNLQKNHNFQPISGAPYIELSLEEQKKMKQKVCFEVFEKIGKLKDPENYFDQWISSPKSYHYRNKMEYSFSTIEYDLKQKVVVDDAFALGFKRKGTWWMVENLDKDSGLFDKELEDLLLNIRLFLKKTSYPAWHPPQKVGFFRHLVVRKSFHSNELLFNLVTSSKKIKEFNIDQFGKYLSSILGKRFAGLIHTINDDVADREKLDKGSSKLVTGKSTIEEKINGFNFEISMQSFFQTNPKCAELLYSKVIEYLKEATIPRDQYIMDLFCGTGTIAQLIAKNKENKVIGVDIVKSAIENAKNNAKKNKITNIKFICDDVGKFLLNNPKYHNKIHTIVIDPPRAGIAPKALRKAIRLNAQKIIYVSCNPSTQARDLHTLSEMGYEMEKFSLVDQFPHTAHIESIMTFKKSTGNIDP
tara:strand:+ start:1152 stop:2591 length:1440 start_codon:yes stop_codon:yes gene_type:complete